MTIFASDGLKRPISRGIAVQWLVGLFAVLLVVIAVAGPAWAHHTGAMYDRAQTLTLKGKVTEFQFTNPHSWVRLSVPVAGNKVEEWDIECSAPSRLSGWGMTPETIKAGDEVTITTHPLRDGRKGGSLVTALLANGKLVDTGSNAAPGSADAAGGGKAGAAAGPGDAGAAFDPDAAYPDANASGPGIGLWLVIGLVILLALGGGIYLIAGRKKPGTGKDAETGHSGQP